MAYTTINKSTDYFNTLDYNGNGSNRTIIDVGFQPDWVWIKHRNGSSNHNLFDVLRGPTKYIESSSTAPDQTGADRLTGFASDGFDLGSNGGVNGSGETYVSWNWKANGAGSANTDGNTATTVSVNTTSGFSIVKWTGTSGNTTIGHGLGVVPEMVIGKNTGSNGTNWIVYHKNLTSGYFSKLNLSNAQDNANSYFTADPTNSILSLTGNTAMNSSGNDMIAYCFAGKTGYSKFGSYTGNGSTNGPFVYTGFKPAFLLIKSSTYAGNWLMYDDKRELKNIDSGNPLNANEAGTESPNVNYAIDFLSNGFKLRNNNGNIQNNGEKMFYMAFAEAPLVGTNGVTAKAR
jgi:hypothetical protein